MRKILIAMAVSLVVLVMPLRSSAAVTAVIAGPGNSASGTYVTPVAILAKAGPMTFINADIEAHNVVASKASGARAERPWCPSTGFCPLFWSETIGIGSTPILGLSKVASGSSYEFFCTVHPNMKGTLVVV